MRVATTFKGHALRSQQRTLKPGSPRPSHNVNQILISNDYASFHSIFHWYAKMLVPIAFGAVHAPFGC